MSDVRSSANAKIETNNDINISGPKVSEFDDRQVMGSRNEVLSKVEKQRSLQNLYESEERSNSEGATFQRGRSNSDGAAEARSPTIVAFPSLPNAVLEKLGLYGDASREILNDESLEQKFTSLALAFTIDATTIKDRCERQRRSRDQTETNFNLEVEKLKHKLGMLKPLCMDVETADLLSNFYSQVETLSNAASLVWTAAERFGAVQHEERLTDSVQLMVSHVQALKQQRDSALRQLQYTKVLQEPVDSREPKTSNSSTNKALLSKRRASTDSVNLNPDHNLRLSRRTSDLSFRASLNKGRQSRVDLNEIKEFSCEDSSKDQPAESTEVSKEDADSDFELSNGKCISSQVNSCPHPFKGLSFLVRSKVDNCLDNFQKRSVGLFNKWSENGYLHVFLNFCAILCFSVSVLTLMNMLLEQTNSPTISSYWCFNWLSRK
ncbi:inositol 1,4,5-triphosphate receptor associated 2-like isoform X2 [Euwallacea fornicatus]|uniref:inositol 1,4,5-triphosphate receptor associated 2-like isoform X2 n=1 Tax=Euwallacea fornicatus TaxID=995702 RepID=UPI00338E0CBC